MATFEYNALTSAGRLMKGTIEAGSREEVSEQLKHMQLSVNSIDKAKPKKPRTAIGRNQFMLFNQQLASITKACESYQTMLVRPRCASSLMILPVSSKKA